MIDYTTYQRIQHLHRVEPLTVFVVLSAPVTVMVMVLVIPTVREKVAAPWQVMSNRCEGRRSSMPPTGSSRRTTSEIEACAGLVSTGRPSSCTCPFPPVSRLTSASGRHGEVLRRTIAIAERPHLPS